MELTAFIVAISIIAVTGYFLYKKTNPQGLLLLSGLVMLALGIAFGINPSLPAESTGSTFFDVVKLVEETFTKNFSRAGLMIMTIGGYVAFMNAIKATDALVYLSMKPLHWFRKFPYLAAIITIPIGQMLFITTPSAAGLGLLLVASFFPVLINLGVSRLTALSVIAAATIFDQGPGSANTALAAQLIGQTNDEYFITHQMPLVIPTTLVVMTLYYFSNRYFDRKDQKNHVKEELPEIKRPEVPLFFAILPVLPLATLVIFSPFVGLIGTHIKINTTIAMIFSLFVSLIAVAIFNRNFNKTFSLFSAFWKGMGNVFASVVTLIVAAEVFSKGLISLGFIDSLVNYSSNAGLTGVGISVIFAIVVFGAAVLMGSGNAAFFSFGPLLPLVATRIGLPAFALVLPLQLSASMGRAASPIAGIIVAIAGVGGVSPMELAKRNMIPLTGGFLFLLAYHFITL